MQKSQITSFTGSSAVFLVIFFLVTGTLTWERGVQAGPAAPKATQGSLQVVDGDGSFKGLCPLKHTKVEAEISGFLARVNVTQKFENPNNEKVEGVYTFPLPQNAAVDDMTLLVGDRVVRGRIKRREEARAVYEAARAAGHVAGLLDQERPNIFTQSVANIMPGARVEVTISYVEWLTFKDGAYEFVFPMVVGPRYIPGDPTGKKGGGWAPDTDRVPDASRITPPVSLDPATMTATRAGHDISIEVEVDAGVPLAELRSRLHDISVESKGDSRALVRLADKAVIPNKDFILDYRVAGRKIEDAVMVHRGSKGGFFTLVMQPPERISAAAVNPKELVFVLDTSGSMMGFPIEKAKEAMKLALETLYPQDTFNLITFAGDTRVLFPGPVPANPQNLRLAQEFLASRSGRGGTEMMKAIRAALEPSDAQDHVRIVCFMTDGYVGNDMEIISEVKKHPNARVFAFGIGNSVNRFLLDRMAEYGRGEVEYVTLSDDGSAAARRFHERVRNPLLTDVSIEWGGLPVRDIYPRLISDMFSAKPLVVCGRYDRPGSGMIRISGKMPGGYFVRDIHVSLARDEPRHDVLATLWARNRIADLMGEDYYGIQQGTAKPDLREEITQLGLDFRIMTQFTSFVAVEEMTVTDGGEPRRIEVPVELPDGVDPAGIFGEPVAMQKAANGMARGFVGGVVGGRVAPAAMPATISESARNQTMTPKIEVDTALRTMADRIDQALSPEERKRQAIAAKLHPSVAAVIERVRNGNFQVSPDEARFVRNGKAEIQVWLTDKEPKILQALKALGFEIVLQPKAAAVIVGRISIEKLSALAELDAVRYVAPL